VSVAVGERIVTLFGDVEGAGAELRLLDPADWSELDRLGLSGPPLGLSADVSGAPRVAVGLGSGGMAVVEIAGDELMIERMLEPPAVVTQGLLDGELAAAVTLSGVFVWSLPVGREQAPRLFGFGAAAQLGHQRAGNMLHGLLVVGELLTSDWLHVERWALEPAGEVVELDVPRGVYVGPEGPVRWGVRNPGGIPLRAELRADHEVVLAQRVEPGEVVELELSAEQRRRLLAPEDPSVMLLVRVYDVAIPSAGEPLSSSAIVLVQRDPSSMYPPSTGEQFPTLTLADQQLGEVFTFPPAGGGQTIWMWPDCALIWPLGEDIYAESFFISELPGDAMPTDYVVDADGTIRSIERMYRGRGRSRCLGPGEFRVPSRPMARRSRQYWLMKSEPDVFSIDDLERKGREAWDGVRNFQARNFMRDQMAVGDLVLFYHSNATPPGVAGLARVASAAYPDPSAFDPDSKYYDPDSDPDAPRWWLVDVEFVEKFAEQVSLDALKAAAKKELAGMLVARRGQRLSVQPVEKDHFVWVLRMAKAKARVR
jgi:predicted RNA-binding protein with PUA-like domain